MTLWTGRWIAAAALAASLAAAPVLAQQVSAEFEAITAAAKGPDPISSMVFGERDLDAIVALAERVEDGTAPPWSLFRQAWDAERRGEPQAAADALGAVLRLPGTGSGVALWTWSNLRRLGFEPVASLADEVQGVVYEVPVAAGRVEYLAAYRDGRWRVLRDDGTGVFWEERQDPTSNAITAEILATAQRLSFWAENTPRRDPSAPTAPRITLLTWAGMRQISLSGPLNRDGTPTQVILSTLTGQVAQLQDFAAKAAAAER